MRLPACLSLSSTSLRTAFKEMTGEGTKVENAIVLAIIFQIHSGVAYEHRLARPALRRANVDEETWLHINCDAYAGARHRRQHSGLQRGECGADSRAAVSQSGPVGRAVLHIGGRSARRHVHSGDAGVSVAIAIAGRPDRVHLAE